jgi:tRNA-dihydrouridine synthase B
MGEAEYDTIAEVKSRVGIPVIANGDIDSPAKAAQVLAHTGADGVMIGRAAQGRPWIFREIEHYLKTGEVLPPPLVEEIHRILRGHLADLYAFYGVDTGVRVARQHIGWYTRGLPGSAQFRFDMNQLRDAAEQTGAVDRFFGAQARRGARLAYIDEPEEEAA